MSIQQLTVFVANQQGALVAVTDLLAESNVDIRALSIADTHDFGILRLIVNDTATAEKVLRQHDYLVQITEVVAVKISDLPGRLSKALLVLDQNEVNVEYLYAFLARTPRHAYVVLRVQDNAKATAALEKENFHMVSEADVKKL